MKALCLPILCASLLGACASSEGMENPSQASYRTGGLETRTNTTYSKPFLGVVGYVTSSWSAWPDASVPYYPYTGVSGGGVLGQPYKVPFQPNSCRYRDQYNNEQGC